MLLLSFAFHDLKFCLSSQLKAASCALCSSEMPPSKQVNGHSFTTCLIVWGSPQSQSGEAINDLFGTSTTCHRVRQRCWMVGASSGRLDHIGRLDFSRGRG